MISRKCRKLTKLNSPKINDPIMKWTTELNRSFPKAVQIAKKYEKLLIIPGHK
jgi:hypothetical protein